MMMTNKEKQAHKAQVRAKRKRDRRVSHTVQDTEIMNTVDRQLSSTFGRKR